MDYRNAAPLRQLPKAVSLVRDGLANLGSENIANLGSENIANLGSDSRFQLKYHLQYNKLYS